MSNIRATISATTKDHPNASTSDIAHAIAEQSTVADLYPLILDAVEHARRDGVRAAERAVTSQRLSLIADRVYNQPEMNRPDCLASFLDQRWRLGDGTVVKIGEATLPEVRQRLDMLYRQRDGLNRTIEVLESIAGELERTGARCLNDLMIEDVA